MLWDILLLLSLLWVVLRLYQLTKLPREVLEERLGYEIPAVPEVSIAGIRPHSILLYWLNAADASFVGARTTVLCNGIKLGVAGRVERPIEISPLRSQTCYNIKVISTNVNNVSTVSAATRVRTIEDQANTVANDEAPASEPASVRKASASFHSRSSHSSTGETLPNPPSTIKFPGARRGNTIHQSGPFSAYEAAQITECEDDESSQSVQSLTLRLEVLKKQKEETDRQVEVEEAEAKVHQSDLFRDRDDLRYELRQKEDSSTELRKQGNQLDKLNRGAQSKRTAKERKLQQRKAERQKIHDDINRWEVESSSMVAESDALEVQLQSMITINQAETDTLRRELFDLHDEVKMVEDEVRNKGVQIKNMENRSDESHGQNVIHHGNDELERAREEIWEANLQSLYLRLQSLWNALQQSKTEEKQAENHLAWWLAKRARNPSDFPPVATPEYNVGVQRVYSHKMATNHGRSNTQPSQGAYGGPSHHAAALPSFLPFFGSRTAHNTSPSQADLEVLTGGAMTSPAANDLLPSYILRDEDSSSRTLPVDEPEIGFAGQIGRHTISSSDASARAINTPISASSRSGSIFTSPHDSMHNVGAIVAEGDDRPVLPSGAQAPMNITPEATSQASSRFANIFSPFARQRAKPTTPEPPALGTLKQGQSQSFPRQLDQDVLDTSGLRRRRGSHNTWANPVASLLGRGEAETHTDIVRARAGSNRSNRLSMLRPRTGTIESTDLNHPHHIDSRASSTYSIDQTFNRPSSESQNIWNNMGDTMPNHSSPASTAWNLPGSRWSMNPSRRASIQQGSSTNLSLGTAPLDTDNASRPISRHRAEQAPIGTRPSAIKAATPKLNPAAPSFKTLFVRSDGKKAAKAEKAARAEKSMARTSDAAKTKASGGGEGEGTDEIEDSSPPNSRQSRDAQSVTTATSTTDSRESFERLSSATASDSPTPKETLMQRITRKSSSSKFNVPWGKDRGIFSKRAAEPSTPGEVEAELSSSNYMGKGSDSAPHTPRDDKSSRGWSSIRRKSKRGNDAAEAENETEEEE